MNLAIVIFTMGYAGSATNSHSIEVHTNESIPAHLLRKKPWRFEGRQGIFRATVTKPEASSFEERTPVINQAITISKPGAEKISPDEAEANSMVKISYDEFIDHNPHLANSPDVGDTFSKFFAEDCKRTEEFMKMPSLLACAKTNPPCSRALPRFQSLHGSWLTYSFEPMVCSREYVSHDPSKA
ncbi:hypothetical protein PsorP6_006026 [Peronosclerospora sorghi]|uniref:Uncharacterized protein n=1 Tax=Peronosclerospora sorghi TaxID=230839 RepID=A0ACC0W5A6_9STRA|nr:hypothetical protein PsorP6_006026 [Peronosclerospora sorghi]